MNLEFHSRYVLHQEKILTAIDRAEIRSLKRIGALSRKRMRRKLRRRKRVALPGQSPSVHSRHKFATLKNILFYVDAKNKTVISGAIKLSNSKVKGSHPLPELLEFGNKGVVTLDDGTEKVVDYDAFPFSGPTLDEILADGSVSGILKDSVLP